MATRRRPSFIYLGGQERETSVTISHNNSPNFEFEESDVWNSNNETDNNPVEIGKINPIPRSSSSKKLAKRDRRSPAPAPASMPVSIPNWSRIHAAGDDDSGEDERIPPHEYLARTRTASLSVHEGIGRTLKGRDMSKVRNAIWKQIGFED